MTPQGKSGSGLGTLMSYRCLSFRMCMVTSFITSCGLSGKMAWPKEEELGECGKRLGNVKMPNLSKVFFDEYKALGHTSGFQITIL
jgi:hypothetical protein